MLEESLLDQIYEAAVLPDRWPPILQRVADQVGAMGACFIAQSTEGTNFVTSPGVEQQLLEYVAEGWADHPERTAPLFLDQYPGFRAETDYRTKEEIVRMPAHAEFLDPRGMFAGAATAIQGTAHRALFLAFEGFPSHEAASAAVPQLDTLRSHFARAISLTALHSTRTQVVVDSLALAGAAAAVIGREGKLRAANGAFVARMGDRMIEGPLGLRFIDPFVQQQFVAAIERHRAQRGRVQSVAVHNPDGGSPFAIHLLPIKGAAREVCDADGVLLLIADGSNAQVPNADLLRVLFDLTPAEARLARLLAQGHAIADASGLLAITEATARVHLKSVFAKTGVSRQAELVRLLIGLSMPTQT